MPRRPGDLIMPVTSQHKLDTNRAPRVQITYDVFTNGAKIQRELPFVVGILADLSGKPEQPLPRLEEHEKRKFVEIDGANFDDIMTGAAPRLKFTVDNTLAEDGAPID